MIMSVCFYFFYFKKNPFLRLSQLEMKGEEKKKVLLSWTESKSEAD